MNGAYLVALLLPTVVMGYYLVRKAVAAKPEKFRLSDYFLAGGRIGPTNTLNNALGSNVALANGFWYFVVIGYVDGGFGVIAQVTWCLSIFLVGYLVPTILRAANAGQTLHGFLGASYGSELLRVGCAVVTGTGYLLNFGFETFVSGTILASVIGGDERLKWIITLAIALSSAFYIGIAGFIGNVSQDRKQNIIGISSFVVMAIAVAWTIFGSQTSPAAPVSSWFVALPVAKYFGIIAYTLTFNMVDVSNWQTVAANRFVDDNPSVAKLRTAWSKTALLAFIFPGVTGVFVGCLLRGQSGLQDNQLFGVLTSLIFPGADPMLRAIVVGLLAMGFFILALGYAENLLSAAQFTFIADVFKRRRYDLLVTSATKHHEQSSDDEDRFVRGCQRSSFLISLTALGLFFIALQQFGEGEVFNLMFLIFGSTTSMAPAVLTAAFRIKRGKSCSEPRFRRAAISSIGFGYLISMSPLVFPDFAPLSPVFTILGSTIVLLLVSPFGAKSQATN